MTNISRIEAHSSSTEAIAELSADLKDELATTAKEAGLLAVRYCELKAAKYLIPATGEVLEANRYKRELDGIAVMLKEYIDRTGEQPFVEGAGSLRLQDRAGEWSWDVKALAEADPATFARLLELGCITLHTKIADEQEKAGNVSLFRQYGHRGNTRALVIDKGDK